MKHFLAAALRSWKVSVFDVAEGVLCTCICEARPINILFEHRRLVLAAPEHMAYCSVRACNRILLVMPNYIHHRTQFFDR